MNHKLTKIFLLLMVLAVLGCSKQQGIIEGNWNIDLEPMIQQAKSLGASTKQIQEMTEMFVDGKLSIDSSRITLTIEGVQGNDVKEYTVVSKDGQCVDLTIKGASGVHKYCVDGKRLEVHDPGSKLVAVYRRS